MKVELKNKFLVNGIVTVPSYYGFYLFIIIIIFLENPTMVHVNKILFLFFLFGA